MTRRIVIVRHGNTFEAGEPPRRIGRRTDLPLTATGRAQVLALAAAFAGQGLAFDTALAGPLARTSETATLILGALVAPPELELVEWLAEIDHGPDEGAVEADVVARLGQAALDCWDRAGVAPGDWVTDRDAREAAWASFFAAQAKLPSGAALLATSNGAARFALLGLGALVPAGLKLRTGAYGEIVLSGGKTAVVAWNVRPSA